LSNRSPTLIAGKYAGFSPDREGDQELSEKLEKQENKKLATVIGISSPSLLPRIVNASNTISGIFSV
jgi:hypothetical protein